VKYKCKESNEHSGKLKNTSDQHCDEWSVWHHDGVRLRQSSVI